MEPATTIDARKGSVRAVRGKQHGDGYDKETVYLYFVRAGGCVNKAYWLAAENGEERVPRDRGTWYSCAEHFGFKQRYERDLETERREFREEMERVQMEATRELAACFHRYVKYMSMLITALWKEYHEGKHDVFKLLSNGSPFSIRNFYNFWCIYRDVLGLPRRPVAGQGQSWTCPQPTIPTLTPQQTEKLLKQMQHLENHTNSYKV